MEGVYKSFSNYLGYRFCPTSYTESVRSITALAENPECGFCRLRQLALSALDVQRNRLRHTVKREVADNLQFIAVPAHLGPVFSAASAPVSPCNRNPVQLLICATGDISAKFHTTAATTFLPACRNEARSSVSKRQCKKSPRAGPISPEKSADQPKHLTH
jgi:hypothetical protein